VFILNSLPSIFIYTVLLVALFAATYPFLRRYDTIKPTETKTTIFILLLIILGGYLLRIFIAPIIQGHPSDISCFKAWANLAATDGLSRFYLTDMFVDYPPGYVYILYVIGWIRNVFSLSFDSGLYLTILKLPAITSDIICSVIIFYLARKKINTIAAGVLSILYVFNPAVIFNSSVYGQVDSFFTLCILLMLLAIYKHKLQVASIIFVIGVLIKPQTLIFAPILCYAMIEKRSLKTILSSFLCAAITFVVIILPFSIHQGPFWIFKLYYKTLSSYPYASANAFNIFALFGGNGAGQNRIFLMFPYKIWGAIFLVGIVATSAVLYFKSKKRSKVFLISSFVMAAVFMLSCKMHERYIFPFILLSLVSYIFISDRRLLFVFLGFSVTAYLNQSLLINSILTKQSFWFSSGDMLVKFISFINLLLLVYLIKIVFDICLKGKVLPIGASLSQGLLGEHELKNVKAEELIDEKVEKISLRRKDYLAIGALTLIYAVLAFYNLGSFKAPQSYWQPTKSGEGFYVDFGQSKDIEKVNYFASLGQGSYKLEFSQDRNIWSNKTLVENKSSYEPIGWRSLAVNVKSRYARIICESPGAMLNEVCFFSPENKKPIVLKSLENINSVSVSPENRYENVFDEQAAAVYTPSFFNSMYFDEVYHGRTGYEYIRGVSPSETTHPPLGKVIISIGIRLFGMTPFGWRIMGVLFGVAMVPLMYLFGLQIFRKSGYAFIASFLFCFDFMNFVQSRISTIDIYAVCFIVLMYYFMCKYFRMNFFEIDLKKTFVPLLFSGICFGLAVACKWTGLLSATGIAVVFFTTIGQRTIEYIRARKRLASNKDKLIVSTFYNKLVLTGLWCVLVFVLLPGIIYAMSYIPRINIPGAGYEFSNIIASQKHMYSYHSQLEATHPFSSTWWQLPIITRPVWLYMGQHLEADKASSLVSMGNPAVWWTGLAAIIATAVISIYKKDKTMYVVLIAVAATYLPWALIARELLFIYHFFPTVPFMVLCIVYVLKSFKEKYPKFNYTIFVYLAVVAILFVMFYPVLSGLVVDKSYIATYLRWFDSWIF